jgi:hypothetical protein
MVPEGDVAAVVDEAGPVVGEFVEDQVVFVVEGHVLPLAVDAGDRLREGDAVTGHHLVGDLVQVFRDLRGQGVHQVFGRSGHVRWPPVVRC